MRGYSHQYYGNQMEETVFDDDATDFNDSTADLKFRQTRTNNQVIHRALSTVSANQSLVYNQRNVLAKNFRRISINDEIVTIDHIDAEASFLLPNLYKLPDEIRARVMNSLVDTMTMTTLEDTKRLNWWVNKRLPCPKLYPLLTSGDGNCLLHATSLAMWGFHDHSLSMRKALNETLTTSKPNNSLYRRWRWTQSVQNKKYGLVFSEQEWSAEWKSLLRLSSTEPRISQSNSSDVHQHNQDANRAKSSQIETSTNTGGSTRLSAQSTRQYYESLEEFHVYVLANNIRRPIIVYSDTVLRTNDGEAISPIEFGGIYLPLEIPPEKCHKQPVFLAFDAAHFSALVPMEENSKVVSKAMYRIPLIDIATNDLLPIHFFIDPGSQFSWPIDAELSDEKIHLYTQFGFSRMEILESYLNHSEETLSLDDLHSIENKNVLENDATSTSVDSFASHNETVSTTTPVMQKKLSRSSLNSFSKMIRRTFIEPFSSVKRASFKQQRQQSSADAFDSSAINENDSRRRVSSPLLNPHTNVLKIILTNFQPKRPKTSDNMIKNYIDACMNEYRPEKNKQRPAGRSTDEIDQTINPTRLSEDKYQQPVITNYRSYTTTPANRTHQETDLATLIMRQSIERKKSSNTTTGNISPRKISSSYDNDDNDDSLLLDNGQISSNINYVQTKSRNLAQSSSFEMNQTSQRYFDTPFNGLSSNHTKLNYVNDSSSSRSNLKPSSVNYQVASLRRQQSLGYDRNNNSQRTVDHSTNTNRGSTKGTVNVSQAQRLSQEKYTRTANNQSARRS